MYTDEGSKEAGVPLAVAFADLYLKKATGKLVVRTETGQDEIFLQQGTPVFVRLSKPMDTLGRILLTMGAIDEMTYNRSLQVMASSGKRQGEVLMELGVLEQGTLEKALKIQQRRKLARLLKTKPKLCEFLDGETCVDCFPVDPVPSVLSGLRECLELDQVESLLSEWINRPVSLALERWEPVKWLDDAENELLSNWREPKKPESVIESSGLPAFQVATLLLGMLLCGKLVQVQVEENKAVKGRRKYAESGPSSSPAPTGPGPSGDLDALKARMEEKLKQAENHDYLGLLEVDENAGQNQLARSFFKLAKEFHPDTLAAFAPKVLVDKARTVFSAITEAKDVLSDPDRRKDYLERRKTGKTGPVNVQQDLGARALLLEAEADFAFKRKDWNTAISRYKGAADLEPTAKRLARLGWSIWAKDHAAHRASAMASAMAYMEKALTLDRDYAEAYKFVGRLLKLDARKSEAYNWFKRALALNPSDTEAASEVRLAEMRAKKDKKERSGGRGPTSKSAKRGIFGFGKKG